MIYKHSVKKFDIPVYLGDGIPLRLISSSRVRVLSMNIEVESDENVGMIILVQGPESYELWAATLKAEEMPNERNPISAVFCPCGHSLAEHHDVVSSSCCVCDCPAFGSAKGTVGL